MSPPSDNFFGNRLKMARKMAGFSLQHLSDLLNKKVTKQSLSKYENGAMSPSNDVLLEIANALNVKPEYLLRKSTTELGQIQFRKKARLSARHEDMIVEKVRNYAENLLEIEDILGIFKKFINPIEDIQIQSWEDVEFAAEKLRIIWGLGANPVHSIVDCLERNGIKIYLSEEVQEFDGLAVYTSNDIPLIAVNTLGKSIERLRFTIVHELAHLILCLDEAITSNDKLVEEYCHYFASNFLLPRNELIQRIGGAKRKYIRIQELISIKHSFGISIRATVHRLKKLKIITEEYYRRWMIYMSKTYGAKEEPGNFVAVESPSSFKSLVNRALAEDYISISKASSLLGTSIAEIRKGI